MSLVGLGADEMRFELFNDDLRVAEFNYDKGIITGFSPVIHDLLPKQLLNGGPEMFSLWLSERAIDLNTFQHRELMQELMGSRDRIAIALTSRMFSITDTFTCFPKGDFRPRESLWQADTQEAVSDFVLISSDTSLRQHSVITPNASTDGSFPKTWKHENGQWWLYKIQSPQATRSEREISHVLRACGWDAAEYAYVGSRRSRIKSKNFVEKGTFFEPYDSFRFMFANKEDADEVIYGNLSSLGRGFEQQYRRILLADALFMNTDRHMRNFGVIRSSQTGQVLRMATNFDNNQAYLSNKGTPYSSVMLRMFAAQFGITQADRDDLTQLIKASEKRSFLQEAVQAGKGFLDSHPKL